MSIRLKVALSKLEIAAADYRYEQDEMQAAMRSTAMAADLLGTEMKLAMLAANCVRDDEGYFLPELLEAQEAATMASVELTMATAIRLPE